MPDLPEDPLLAPGTIVGDYELVRVVGAGSFGTVYEGRHPVIAKRVAIKVLASKYSSEPSAVARFVSEARVVNEIRHRNIVDIFSFGSIPDGRQYFVMEYLDGPTLQDLLRDGGKLPLEEALPLLREIASALDAAHRTGVAHRDVKPANIIVIREEGRQAAKLIDFGIAKLIAAEAGVSHQTQTGALVGTPAYMAPEQCRGKAVDHRSDVYAWGLIAHEMLTGSSPFGGKDSLDWMLHHTQTPPPPVSQVNPDLPGAVDAPILATLEKDPDKRPEVLIPVVEKLEALVAATPRKDLRRRMRAALAAAGVVVLAIAAIAVNMVPAASAPQPSPPPVPVVAAEPAPAPPLEPAPVQPAEPDMVKIEIVGAPPGTEVTGPKGAVLGTAPGTILIPQGLDPVRLRFARNGYLPEEKDVRPAADMTVAVSLRRRAVEPAKKKKDKDAIEEPDF